MFFERDRDERKKKIAAFGSRDLLQTQLKIEEIVAAAGITKIHLDFSGGDGGAALMYWPCNQKAWVRVPLPLGQRGN